MLLSFKLPSEEEDGLKVDEETKKIFKIMEGWHYQIASWSHYETRLSYNGSINHFLQSLGIFMWHVYGL